jgi:hypothetical protein
VDKRHYNVITFVGIITHLMFAAYYLKYFDFSPNNEVAPQHAGLKSDVCRDGKSEYAFNFFLEASEKTSEKHRSCLPRDEASVSEGRMLNHADARVVSDIFLVFKLKNEMIYLLVRRVFMAENAGEKQNLNGVGFLYLKKKRKTFMRPETRKGG